MEPSVSANRSKSMLSREFLLDWLSGYAVRDDSTDNITDFVTIFLYQDYLEAKFNLLQQENKSTLINLLVPWDIKNPDMKSFLREKYQRLDKFALALAVLKSEYEGDVTIGEFMNQYEQKGDLSLTNIFLEHISGLSEEELRKIVILFLIRDGAPGLPKQTRSIKKVCGVCQQFLTKNY